MAINEQQIQIITAAISMADKEAEEWTIKLPIAVGPERLQYLLEVGVCNTDGMSEVVLFGPLGLTHYMIAQAVFSNGELQKIAIFHDVDLTEYSIEPFVRLMRVLGQDPEKIQVEYGETQKLLSDYLKE